MEELKVVCCVIAVSTVVSIAISLIVGKMVAAHTFLVIDGYVKDIVDMAKKSIRDAYLNK